MLKKLMNVIRNSVSGNNPNYRSGYYISRRGALLSVEHHPAINMSVLGGSGRLPYDHKTAEENEALYLTLDVKPVGTYLETNYRPVGTFLKVDYPLPANLPLDLTSCRLKDSYTIEPVITKLLFRTDSGDLHQVDVIPGDIGGDSCQRHQFVMTTTEGVKVKVVLECEVEMHYSHTGMGTWMFEGGAMEIVEVKILDLGEEYSSVTPAQTVTLSNLISDLDTLHLVAVMVDVEFWYNITLPDDEADAFRWNNNLIHPIDEDTYEALKDW